jgi:seryl-tRNA synthetase
MTGLVAVVSHADAQTARSGGAPNTQLLQQMQQMASERTSLQAENEKMKKELDDLRKERDQLKKKGADAANERLRAGEAALARANQQRESTEQELTQTKAKMQDLIAKFRETLQAMRDVETENATNKQSLTARDRELHVCVDRNLALYKLNDEILAHFDHQGAWSRVAQAEPFTKIKRVQLENLIDEYKGRADDQRAAPISALPNANSSANASAGTTDLKEKR